VTSASSAFDAAVSAHLDAAALLRGARADAREDNLRLRQLHELLAAQATRLGTAATELRLPAPRLSVESTPATPDVDAALGFAESALRRADSDLDRALRAGTMPPLLPAVSPALRATLVYGALSVLAWLIQFILLAAVDYQVGPALLSLCGLPMLAFGAGVLTLQTVGQPRTGERIAYSLPLGAVLCFAALPVMWLILLGGFAILRD
jgi:hypothetical protein